MKVIGFSIGHDKGATLIIDGKVITSISIERINRIKAGGGELVHTIPIQCMKMD